MTERVRNNTTCPCITQQCSSPLVWSLIGSSWELYLMEFSPYSRLAPSLKNNKTIPKNQKVLFRKSVKSNSLNICKMSRCILLSTTSIFNIQSNKNLLTYYSLGLNTSFSIHFLHILNLSILLSKNNIPGSIFVIQK